VQQTKQAIGVTYDGKNFYWTEISEGKEAIVKYNAETKKEEILVTAGLKTPEDIAVDWLTKNIYFTDAEQSHITVCRNDGLYCVQLVNSANRIDRPRAIVLYPTESLMFWTDWGKQAHIGVAFMDGSDTKVLVDNVMWPNGLALDWPNGRIYWVDAQAHTIESATIEGKDRRIVLSGFVQHPYSLALFEDKIYWSDWLTSSIETCDKFTGKNHQTLMQGEQVFGNFEKYSLKFA
jgi:hypothetical protein